MAIIRPIAAVSSAIVAGVLVGTDNEKSQIKVETEVVHSCCSSKKVDQVHNVESTGCCGSKDPSSNEKRFQERLKNGITFAATDLVKDISTWLIIGLFFAALVQTYVETNFLAEWGGSIWSMLLMVAISIPMYICATASTPIAAGLLMSGISPGAVLVFMLTGPATNIATLGIVGKELGRRALLAYLIGVIGTAIAFGLLTDHLVTDYNIAVTSISELDHQILPKWVTALSAVALALLMLRVYVKKINIFEPR